MPPRTKKKKRLNPEATKAADEAFFKAHPERNGAKIKSGESEALKKEWMALYRAERDKDKDSSKKKVKRRKKVKEPVEGCPKCDEPCAIKDLTVTCSHGGRKPSPEGVLQVVPKGMETDEISFDPKPQTLFPWKLTGKCTYGGTDIVKATVLLNEGSGRKQIAVTDSQGAPEEGEWEDGGSKDVTIEAFTSEELVSYFEEPRSTFISGRGCNEIEKQVEVQNFANDMCEVKFDVDTKPKDDKSLTDEIKEFFLDAAKCSPIEPIFKSEFLKNGSFSAKWGWQEDSKTWKTYYLYEIKAGLNPLFKGEVGVNFSLAKLAGTMIGIPPPLAGIVADHLADVKFHLGADVQVAVAGTAKFMFYADYNDKVEGDVKVTATGTLQADLCAKVGSKYFASASITAGAKTQLIGEGALVGKYEGVFVNAKVEANPLIIFVKAELKVAFVSTSKNKEWRPFGEAPVKLWKSDDIKLLPWEDD